MRNGACHELIIQTEVMSAHLDCALALQKESLCDIKKEESRSRRIWIYGMIQDFVR
jgi:hypothetical protein